jgi:hypothetical protein
VIAHVAGLPIEEFLPTLAGTSTGVIIVRTWMSLRSRIRKDQAE